ncbi:hypothetical protein D3C71_1837140 [compost metagenome]
MRPHRHADAQTAGRDAVNAAHHAHALLQIDQRHVVVAARIGLAPDDAERIDRARARRLGPRQILRAAMHAQHARKKLMRAAGRAALDPEAALGEIRKILLLRPAWRGALHFPLHCPVS